MFGMPVEEDLIQPITKEGSLETLPEKGFQFSCHRSITCFNVCCRDLYLVLTPYDILRLKNAVAMDSSAFLEQYTVTDVDPGWKIPIVKLKMLEDAVRSCPFVGPEGCRVYGNRPGACRTYPLGRATRRSAVRAGAPGTEERYFLVREPHCLGFHEDREWEIAEWLQDQGLVPYNAWNDRWMEFLSRYRPGNSGQVTDEQWRMFFMACYSLDRFREFVFGTRLLSLIRLPEDRVEAFRTSEEELLGFSFQWLAFSIFGDRGLSLRSGSVDDAGP